MTAINAINIFNRLTALVITHLHKQHLQGHARSADDLQDEEMFIHEDDVLT